MLDVGVIDNNEYNNRIDFFKNKLVDSKKKLDEVNSKIDELSSINQKYKLLEDDYNKKMEKQKKFLSMNLVGKKEYEKEISLIEQEFKTKTAELRQ